MVLADTYRAFSEPAQGLQVASRGAWPLLWQATLADRTALHALRAFFATEERPHFRMLAEGFAAAADVYMAPELMANPAQFFRPAAVPAVVQQRLLRGPRGGRRVELTFPSAYQPYAAAYQATYASFRGNETVHARLWQHHGAPRPTVICIHGWGGGYLWLEEQIFAAARLYAAGLNVVVFALPFHGPRKPRGRFDLNLFPSSDFRRTNEAFGQAIFDLQALSGWLRQTGVGDRVGVMGMSLGGYVAALWAGLDAKLDFAMPVISPVSLGDLLWDLKADMAGMAVASAAGFGVEQFRAAMAVHCPLLHALKLAPDRVLIVGGHADRVVPAAHTRALWEHWGQPRLQWFPGGHYMHFGRGLYLREIRALARAPQPAAALAGSAAVAASQASPWSGPLPRWRAAVAGPNSPPATLLRRWAAALAASEASPPAALLRRLLRQLGWKLVE